MDSSLGKVGLCLNGAGAKGMIQVGAIQAVLDHGIEYDAVFGSSAGSLNAALLHQGDAHLMKPLWMQLKNKDVYKWHPWNALDLVTSKAALYNSSPLLRLIKKHVRPDKMVLNSKEFYLTATNYSTWGAEAHECKTLTTDETFQLLYASSSPPIYFPLVPFRGFLLADAGILSNYNIKRAVDAGCNTLIVIGFALPEPVKPENVIGTLGETVSIATYGYFTEELAFVEKINKLVDSSPASMNLRKIKVIRIIPPKPTGIPLIDFDLEGRDREELWQYGYNLGQQALKDL